MDVGINALSVDNTVCPSMDPHVTSGYVTCFDPEDSVCLVPTRGVNRSPNFSDLRKKSKSDSGFGQSANIFLDRSLVRYSKVHAFLDFIGLWTTIQ